MRITVNGLFEVSAAGHAARKEDHAVERGAVHQRQFLFGQTLASWKGGLSNEEDLVRV